MTDLTTMSAAELRQGAADRERQASDSFDRCDTDGFVSQWASGITARLYRKQAEIVENGGTARFLGLYDQKTGERVPAVMKYGDYGPYWALVNPDTNRFTGTFMPSPARSEPGAFPSGRTKMGKLGYYEAWETAPAKAYIAGSGTGLSGAASAYVSVKRADNGWDQGVKEDS